MTGKKVETFTQATNLTEFKPSRSWWMRVLSSRWNHTLYGYNDARGPHKWVDSLSKTYLEHLNHQITRLLEHGSLIVFADDEGFQILDPQEEMLISCPREVFYKYSGFPESLYSLHGQISARIETTSQSSEASFLATCGKTTITTSFDRADASNSPILYAVSLEHSSRATWLFGRLDRNRFFRSKLTA